MARLSPGFEILEHTADTALRGWAATFPSLLEQMGLGLFEVISDRTGVSLQCERHIVLEAESREELLHDWLEELNALHQIHGELYAGFEVSVRGNRIDAVARGETLRPGVHALRLEVKAVTWHDLRVETTPNGFEAYVLLDI